MCHVVACKLHDIQEFSLYGISVYLLQVNVVCALCTGRLHLV